MPVALTGSHWWQACGLINSQGNDKMQAHKKQLIIDISGAEPFFSKLFFKEFFSKSLAKFGKVFGKSYEKSLETGANSEGTCFFSHLALFPRGLSQI
jgi:hypothetical protein